MPAPLLFNLDSRENWSLSEDELDAYMGKYGHQTEEDGEWDEDDFAQPSYIAGFPHQHPGYAGPSAFSSSVEPDYEHARYDPPAWGSYSR